MRIKSMKLAILPLMLIALISLSNSSWAASGAQLANYLGTGDNPRLFLNLSANAQKWNAFAIDYQQLGGIPCGTDSLNGWSAWDVKDKSGNYYGTINLTCSGYTATFVNYSAGTSPNYLTGVNFTYNAQANAYQLTANQIHTGDSDGGIGPFPNTPLATPAMDATQTPITFSTQGPHIVNNKGQTVTLKGVVRPSLEWNPQGQFLSKTDIQNMKKWGANAIRLDLNQNYWFASGPVTQQGSYKQIINAIVYYATQNKMAVILDLHWTTNGGQSAMANQDSIKFWKEVATDYQSFGTVIFELFNEPVNISTHTWLKGDGNYAGYQQLYDAVRNTGAKNLCIVNGLDFGYDLSFVNPNDPNGVSVKGYNIVYGAHPYNGKSNFADNFKGIIGLYPLIFTEFGVNDSDYFPNGYPTVYNNILNYAKQHGISYTAFAWWVDTQNPNTFPDVIADWSGTPINGGVMIHDDMVRDPGTPIQ